MQETPCLMLKRKGTASGIPYNVNSFFLGFVFGFLLFLDIPPVHD